MNEPRCRPSCPSPIEARIHGVSPLGRPRRLRGGFTILELLLASVFGAILLAGLWSLLRTYERLFTSGESRAEHAQLVRAVFDQLAEDLSRAIADNAASASSGPAPVRRFGLFGSSQSIQVDVLRPIVPEEMPLGEEEQGLPRNRPASPRVPELHTIQWRFSDPASAAAGARSGRHGGPSWSGLARRELDWETPVSAAPSGSKSRGIGRLRMKFRLSQAEISSRPKADGALDWNLDDPNVLHIPEVVEAAFRYFDGQGFSDEWNSLSRKSLPMAVEVVLRFKTETASQRRIRVEAEADERRAAAQVEPLDGEVHRMLIYLPTTSLARRAEPEKPSLAAPVPAVVYRPRPVPPPRFGGSERPSSQAVPPDQWMRTGQ
jgi:type II secretory pathway component PulJ